MRAEELRRSILQQAIEGRLVAQDATDEPASVLLERIRAEREQLIKDKKVKRDKGESQIFRGDDGLFYERIGKTVTCIDDELPFAIPNSWEWCRFGAFVKFSLGKTPERNNSSYWGKGCNWVSISDMKDKETIYVTKESITPQALQTKFNDIVSPKGTLIMSFKLTIGKVSILGMDAVHNEAIVSIFPSYDENEIIKRFLLNLLCIITANTSSTDAIKGATLNSAKIYSMFIPVPPLAEQQRIVERLNELEPLLAEYDRLESEDRELDAKLPVELNKSILQYAIEGKLVGQDPSDEPASILLDRIRDEKEQLIKAKKVKRDKNESHIYRADDGLYYETIGNETRCINDELPFTIPDSWAWCRLGMLTKVKGGKRVPKGYRLLEKQTPYIYIRVTDMKNHTISDSNLRYIDDTTFNTIKNYTISKDDLYLTIAGTIGYVGTVPEQFDGMCLTENAVKLTNLYVSKEFLLYMIQTNFIQDQFSIKTKEVAQPKLAIERINSTLIPLPPLAEQQRIVEKLTQIKGHIKI